MTSTSSVPVELSTGPTQMGNGMPPSEGGNRGGIPARRRWGLWLAVAWICLLILVACIANQLPLLGYDQLVGGLPARAAPGWRLPEILGTDATGRSVLSRLVFGARQAIIVGVGAVLIAMPLGMALGIVAAFFRGKADRSIGVVMDALLSIPALILLMAIASVGQRSVQMLVLGLAVVGTPTFYRLARAATLALVDREYIIASRVLGATNARMMLRELMPAVFLRIMSFAFLFMSFVIVAEGSLSFLGLGVPPPTPSWGGMINDGRQGLAQSPWLVLVPSLCLVVTVAAFIVIGDSIRTRFSTRGSALK